MWNRKKNCYLFICILLISRLEIGSFFSKFHATPCNLIRITTDFFIKVFRFQRKTLLLFYCFFFSIIIIFFLTDFVHAISQRRLDRFGWNFQDWCRMIKTRWQIFCFDDVTSGREISSILSNLEGLVVRNL